jgi:single-strand DNA-binding protein
MSVNKVILVGNLGQDPELKTLDSGKKVCNFSMATTERWTDKSGAKQEKTEWHRVEAWDRTAENCAQYLKKGSKVYVEGSIKNRTWDKPDGTKGYSTSIHGSTVQFLDSKGAPQTQPEEERTL